MPTIWPCYQTRLYRDSFLASRQILLFIINKSRFYRRVTRVDYFRKRDILKKLKVKKIILVIILIIQTFYINAQLSDSEKQSLDSLLKSGKLNSNQVNQLQNKWFYFRSPIFKVNNSTGEIYISDILTFANLDKKIIFQRCLEWIALNYGNLIYNDLESGKIIANGLMDLTHYAEYPAGFGSMKISKFRLLQIIP